MNIVANYRGVQIEESCGYFYPTFNGNLEFKTLKAAREWVFNTWLPSQRQLKQMGLLQGFNFLIGANILK